MSVAFSTQIYSRALRPIDRTCTSCIEMAKYYKFSELHPNGWITTQLFRAITSTSGVCRTYMILSEQWRFQFNMKQRYNPNSLTCYSFMIFWDNCYSSKLVADICSILWVILLWKSVTSSKTVSQLEFCLQNFFRSNSLLLWDMQATFRMLVTTIIFPRWVIRTAYSRFTHYYNQYWH